MIDDWMNIFPGSKKTRKSETTDAHLARSLEEHRTAAISFRESLGPYSHAILVRTDQGQFAVPAEDRYVGRALRVDGHYGSLELNYWKSVCDRDTRLLVVGAHLGALTIPLSRLCKRVVAVEANPRIFELLRLNVLLNDVRNCRLINIAANDRLERLEFLASTVNSGGSKRKPLIDWHYYFDDPELIEVEASPLDIVLADEVFDVILMDIEGSEYFALKGMQRLLESASKLQVEFLPHHLKYVAGKSVADFAATITPYFSSMLIAGKGRTAHGDDMAALLCEMFNGNEENEGLIFSKG